MTYVGVLLLGTGLDVVLYQSWLRPLSAEVRFFSLLLPAAIPLLAVAILLAVGRQRMLRLRLPGIIAFSFLLFILGILFASVSSLDSTLHWSIALQWIFGLIFMWWLLQHKWHRSILRMGLVSSALFTSVLAIYQVLHQGSLGLRILGESSFHLTTVGSSKFALGEILFLRGYGLFPHPNIAFGWVGMGLIAFLLQTEKQAWKTPSKTLIIVLLSIGLLATASKSLLFLPCIGVIVWAWQQRARLNSFVTGGLILGAACGFFFLTTPFWFTDTGLHRLDFLHYAWEVFLAHPLGVGLGHSAASLLTFGTQSPWMLQPVHNVFALLFVEAGILGGIAWILLLSSFWFFSQKTSWILHAGILFLIMTSLVDHYWITHASTFLASFWLFSEVLAPQLARSTRRRYTKKR